MPVLAQDTSAPQPPADATQPAPPSGFDRFRATLGVDDGAQGHAGTVRFIVQLDDKEVFHTDVMRPGDPARPLDLPLNGAHSLRLIVDDAGDGHGGDWGDWADARLVNSQTGETLFLSDLNAIVEREWIATRLDRNLIQNPLKLNGAVYARGLGTDSGSSMLYQGLDTLAQARGNAELSIENAGIAAWGPVTLHGAPGANTRVLLNGADVTASLREGRSLPYSPASTLLLRAEKPPVGVALVGPEIIGTLALQGRENARLSLVDVLPTRIQALDAASAVPPQDGDPPVILGGQPYGGVVSTGQPTLLTYRSLLSALNTAVAIPRNLKASITLPTGLAPGAPRPTMEWRLRGLVGLDAPQKTRYGLVRFRLFADERLIWQSHPVTPVTPPQALDIPFPHCLLLRLEVDGAGDGLYHDEADWADLRLTDAHSKPIAYLTDFRAFSQWQNWGTPQRDLSATRGPLLLEGKVFSRGLGVAANSTVLYRGLDALTAARQSAEEAVANAAALAADPQKAAEELEKAISLFPELASAYSARAQLAQAHGDSKTARANWQRLLDVAAASPEERQRAQMEIARLEPALAAGLPPSEPTRARESKSVSLHDWAEGSPVPIMLRTAERTLPTSAVGTQQGEIAFDVANADAGKWLTVVLNSRGLEVSAAITAAGQPYKPLTPVVPGRNPTVRWRAQPGRYLLSVTHDPGKDDFRLPWEMGAVAALTSESAAQPPKPTERWRYVVRNDGSVAVTVTINGPTVLLLPRTAEAPDMTISDTRFHPDMTTSDTRFHLDTPGVRSLLQPAAFTYDSTLEELYALGDGLLLAPGPGQTEAILSFVWRDGAYDVPMSHNAPDHAHKHFFTSLRGINADAAAVEVTVALPPSVTRVTHTLPETAPTSSPGGLPATQGGGAIPSGPVYHWTLEPDKSAVLEAENPRLASKWVSAQHGTITVWLPDCAEYRRWLPDYTALLGRISDRESVLMGGYETQEERLIYVSGPAQLSGYGGATWSDPKLSETWIPCDGHVGAYNLLAQPDGAGVEAHEFKWVHLGGIVPDLPRWLQNGMVIWLEEQGKLAGGTAFPDALTWTELAPKAAYFAATAQDNSQVAQLLWLDTHAFGKLTADQKSFVSAMDWNLCQLLQTRYGDTFWPRFWKRERQTPDAYKDLDENAKTARVIDEIAALTGDEAVRDLFRALDFHPPQ